VLGCRARGKRNYSFYKHILGDYLSRCKLCLSAITSKLLVVFIFVNFDLQTTFDVDINLRRVYQRGSSRPKAY
jgi:hypothetical protein